MRGMGLLRYWGSRRGGTRENLCYNCCVDPLVKGRTQVTHADVLGSRRGAP